MKVILQFRIFSSLTGLTVQLSLCLRLFRHIACPINVSPINSLYPRRLFSSVVFPPDGFPVQTLFRKMFSQFNNLSPKRLISSTNSPPRRLSSSTASPLEGSPIQTLLS
jgi:hypothetical protein